MYMRGSYILKCVSFISLGRSLITCYKNLLDTLMRRLLMTLLEWEFKCYLNARIISQNISE